jgi:hypothetical protein
MLTEGQNRPESAYIHKNNYDLARGRWSSLVFLLALIPYVKIGPVGLPTEVQAWSPLVAWAMTIIFLVNNQLKLQRFHLVLFIFSFFFLIYIPISSAIEIQQYLRKSFAFILCSSVALAAYYAQPQAMLRILKGISVAWFFFAILGVILPDVYLKIVTSFVPGALGAFGDRGVTSLAPEATDFGFTMVYFWLITLLSSAACKRKGYPKAPKWLYAIILLNVLMSRSGAGVFGFVIIIAIYFFFKKSNKKVVIQSVSRVLLVLVGLVLLLAMADLKPNTGFRGFDLLVVAVSNPAELIQTTFSYRVAHNLVGLLGFWDSSLLGFGAGSYTIEAVNIYNEYRVDQMLGVEGWYLSNIPNTLKESPLAIFPVILFEYGLLGAFFVVYIFRSVLHSEVDSKYAIFALLFLTWSQSFPVAYPLFWFLLGLIKNSQFYNLNANLERVD